MNVIRIKRKDYEIVEIISNNIFKCYYNNKEYIITKLDITDPHYQDRLFLLNKLLSSGVPQPKLKYFDKKQGYLVREYMEATSLFDYILDHDFDEVIYKKIFYNAYAAKVAGLKINFDLKSWVFIDDSIYYVSLDAEKYSPENDFTKKDIWKWFMGKELADYYEKNGVLIDKTRIKSDFEVNKEMVLMTCKYYM